MKYQVRPGVVLSSICGEYLLIASKEARVHCQYAAQINETAALIYAELCKGNDPDQICRQLSDEYDISEETNIHEEVDSCIQKLIEMGYILKV